MVFNARYGWKPTLLINSVGEQEELSCFERDSNTDAWYSCSINWENQLHVFGGWNQKRQISRLNGYKFERIGTLPFNHYAGGCGLTHNSFIYLCFNEYGSSDYQRCRRSTGPLDNFTEIPLANYEHRQVTTSSSESKSSCLIPHLIIISSCTGCCR